MLKYIRGDLGKTEAAELCQAAGVCPPIQGPHPRAPTCGSVVEAVLISMRFSGSSSSGASSGMTTTGFTCSASADARKKFGGLCRDKKLWWHCLGFQEWLQADSLGKGGSHPCAAEMCCQVPLQCPQTPNPSVGTPPCTLNPQALQSITHEHHTGILPYLWQPRDLDEPLEIQHVRCFLKEVFEAGEEGKKNCSQGRRGGAWQEGRDPSTSARPRVTCETARGNGLGGPAVCRPVDLQ